MAMNFDEPNTAGEETHRLTASDLSPAAAQAMAGVPAYFDHIRHAPEVLQAFTASVDALRDNCSVGMWFLADQYWRARNKPRGDGQKYDFPARLPARELDSMECSVSYSAYIPTPPSPPPTPKKGWIERTLTRLFPPQQDVVEPESEPEPEFVVCAYTQVVKDEFNDNPLFTISMRPQWSAEGYYRYRPAEGTAASDALTHFNVQLGNTTIPSELQSLLSEESELLWFIENYCIPTAAGSYRTPEFTLVIPEDPNIARPPTLVWQSRELINENWVDVNGNLTYAPTLGKLGEFKGGFMRNNERKEITIPAERILGMLSELFGLLPADVTAPPAEAFDNDRFRIRADQQES